MRVIHVGLGNYGIGWFNAVQNREGLEHIAAVDSNEATHSKISEYNVPCCTSLAQALEAAKPDFIINATPPHVHMTINRLAIAHNIPVLMEKPISEDYNEVKELLEYAKDGHKIAVAENYRFTATNIFVKQQIQSRLRNMTGINMVFRQHHHVSEDNYHNRVQQPALIDVGIHHIDMLRFFTDKDITRVYAQLNTPAWSWYNAPSNVKMIAEMEGGLQFCYDCSLDSYAQTSWGGHWVFTAENGAARYIGDKLYFHMGDELIEMDIPKDTARGADKQRILDEFIPYLQGGPTPQTDIEDQAKNAAAAEAAIQSAKTGKAVDVNTL